MKYTSITISLLLSFLTGIFFVLNGQNNFSDQAAASQIVTNFTSGSFHYMTGESHNSKLPPEDLNEAMVLLPDQREFTASLQLPEAKKRKNKFVEGLLIGFGTGFLVAYLTRPEPCESSFIPGLCESAQAAHYTGIMLAGSLTGGLIGLTIKNKTTPSAN